MKDIDINNLFKEEGELEEFAKIGLLFSWFDDLNNDIDTFITTFLGNWLSGNAFEAIILNNINFVRKIEIFKTILKNEEVANKCHINKKDITFIDKFRILRNHMAHSRYHNHEPYKKMLINSKYISKEVPSNRNLQEMKGDLLSIHKKIEATCEYYWDNRDKLPVIQTKNFFLIPFKD